MKILNVFLFLLVGTFGWVGTAFAYTRTPSGLFTGSEVIITLNQGDYDAGTNCATDPNDTIFLMGDVGQQSDYNLLGSGIFLPCNTFTSIRIGNDQTLDFEWPANFEQLRLMSAGLGYSSYILEGDGNTTLFTIEGAQLTNEQQATAMTGGIFSTFWDIFYQNANYVFGFIGCLALIFMTYRKINEYFGD